MFSLELKELTNLKSQIVISSRGGSRAMPCAFTEQGVAMLSSVQPSTDEATGTAPEADRLTREGAEADVQEPQVVCSAVPKEWRECG